MKPITRLISVFLILTFLLACVLTIPIGAATASTATPTAQTGQEDVRFTKKVVSVVYDNSGSMGSSDNRNEYALYATQMLMSLLGENDKLFMTPMNVKVGTNSHGTPISDLDSEVAEQATIEVKLSDPNRNQVIVDTIKNTFLGQVPNGGTPGGAMKYAINKLVSEGLKDKNNFVNSNDNTEYWLVVLTDGDFNDGAADDVTEKHIADYPSLKTIFIGLSSASPQTGIFDELVKKYPLTAYRAVNVADITSTMQKVANQLSGRYTLDESTYSVSSDGYTVTVDLNQAEYSFKNISVIAQNCGATLSSVVYDSGTGPQSMQASRPCIITPSSELGMQNGYSAVINGNPHFTGGKITLKFTKPVSKDSLSILAEPSLIIRSYLEYDDNGTWVSTDMQYINENLSKGDHIRVRYDVYDMVSNNIINVDDLPGAHEASVKYAGKAYGIDDSIPLVVGNNEIVISVSVMDGAYTMYSSIKCIIEEQPGFYRITGHADSEIPYDKGYGEVKYTVYSNDKPVTKDEYISKGFSVDVVAIAPDGSTARVDVGSVNADGTITAKIYASSGKYGTYQITGTVTSSNLITRSFTHQMTYNVNGISIKCEGPAQFAQNSTSEQIRFTILATDKKPLSGSDFGECTWTATATKPDGTPAKMTASVDSSNNVICKLDAQNREYGEYEIKFTVSTKSGESHEHIHKISYYPETVQIKGEHVDSLPTGASTVESKYYVLVDGVKLTKAELAKYTWTITVTTPDGNINDVPFEIADTGDITATIDASSSGYGAYTVNAVFEMIETYREEERHQVKNYPSSVILTIPEGGGAITATEHQFLTNENAFKFELTADGLPFVIENGLTVNKIVVGNVDVTQYATAEGNVWTYIPKPEHFEGGLPVGTQTVSVSVNCPEVPAITASASATLTITPTVYVIEAVESPNTHVDKFLLHKTDAVLYYKVVRDGITLPLEELQAAFDNGEIVVNDEKGTFTKKFWLPAAREVTIETINGEAVIAFKVQKDIIPPFATFAAMFIFNGDRPITTTYNGASLTQNITFDQKTAHIWSYTWRILVILFIIHTILYLIGFFNGKCKSLPKGIFVKITVSDGEDAAFTGKPFNQTFMQRYGWHISRFFLIGQFKTKKLWYHQEGRKIYPNFATLSINEDRDAIFTFCGPAKRELQPLNNGSAAYNEILGYISRWESFTPGKRGGRPYLNEVSSRDVCNIFQVIPGSGLINPNTNTTSISSSYYGIYDEDTGKLAEIVFFIKQAD